MSKVIEVIVSPKGETKLETKGFSGVGCEAASAAFEKALGEPSASTPTPEYFQAEESTQVDVQN